ncbi:unnamed protein product [Trichobilharzia regenti]|nr:unnamed protein product [Trichobilharzia regenti]
MDEIITKWKDLSDAKKYREKGMQHSDLYWRKACSCRDLGNYINNLMNDSSANSLGKSDKNMYKHYVHEGLAACESGLRLNSESHKLDPTDYGTLHALGRWCFEVADLSWLKRKFAATLFSTPPTSTYDEVRRDFKIAPGALVNNSLYLAKTYQRLKDNAQAKQYCLKVLSFPGDDLETEEVIQCWLI